MRHQRPTTKAASDNRVTDVSEIPGTINRDVEVLFADGDKIYDMP